MTFNLVIARITEAAEACEAVPSPCLAVLEVSSLGVKVKVVRVTRHAELICPWVVIETRNVNPLMAVLDRAIRMVIEQ